MKGPGRKVICYGWCGTYDKRSEHRLGWLMSRHLDHGFRETLSTDQLKALRVMPTTSIAANDMYRVRITIEAVKNKRGRFIVRRTRGKA